MSEQIVPLNVTVDADRRDRSRDDRRARARARRQASVNISQTERVASTIAGTLLAAYAARRRGWGGLGLAIAGLELVRRGVTGHCMAYSAMGITTREGPLKVAPTQKGEFDPRKAVKARGDVVVQRPRGEIYRMWRDLSQLPRFMQHLERVDVLSPTRSHWVTKGAAGTMVEWDAEIVAERDGEYLEWCSVAPADVPNRGTVQFVDADGGNATEVIVTLEAEPPAGKLGDLVAQMFGSSPQQEVDDAVRRFREIAEGRTPETDGRSGDVRVLDGRTAPSLGGDQPTVRTSYEWNDVEPM